MPLRLLTPMPGTTVLELVATGVAPFLLSQFGQALVPPRMPAGARGLSKVCVSLLERGPGTNEDVAAALDALWLAGAVGHSPPGSRPRWVTLTPRGAHLLSSYRELVAWASSVTIEPEPAGSSRSWELMADLSQAWTQGLIVLLTARPTPTAGIIAALRRDPQEVEALVRRLADRGLIAQTSRAGRTWVLLKDGKRAVAPLASAVLAEHAFNPTALAAIKPGHVEAISRLCIEAIQSPRFASHLEGTFAIVARLPDGRHAGSVADFCHGGHHSVRPYREGLQVDGGLHGSIDAYLNLIAHGDARRISCFGLNRLGSYALAIAVATSIGHSPPRP